MKAGNESVVTTRGRITIPKEIRKELKMTKSDRLVFFIRPDGNVAFRLKRSR